MSYSKHEWVNNETITAAKMNNIEDGIEEAAQSGGGGYDAIIKLTNASTGYDEPSTLTPTIISGTYAIIADRLDNNEIPVILVCYENAFMSYKWAMPISCITYYSPSGNPPFFTFTVGGYFRPTGSDAYGMYMLVNALYWNANDEFDFD